MREVTVRFESSSDAFDSKDASVHGLVILNGDANRAPIRFDGWLQLFGLLEDLSKEDGPEPPHPRRNTSLR